MGFFMVASVVADDDANDGGGNGGDGEGDECNEPNGADNDVVGFGPVLAEIMDSLVYVDDADSGEVGELVDGVTFSAGHDDFGDDAGAVLSGGEIDILGE